MSRIKNILFLGTMVLYFLLSGGQQAEALKPPHDSSRSIACADCHTPRRAKFQTITSNTAMCFSTTYGCHQISKTGPQSASKKIISRQNASNRFGHLTAIPLAKQSSHGWKIPNVVPEAGVTNWQPGQPFSVLTQKIFCSRCHLAHGEDPVGRFLRASKTGDQICLNCHTARRIGPETNSSVRDVLPSTALNYSHPIEMSYSTVQAAKPDFFESTPQLAPGYDESARPRLYTTIGGTRGAVVCSTCHGPIHSSDSNPYTFDNLSSFSRLGNISTSAGNLLRQYPMTRSNNLCVACHKVTTHQNFKCSRCHAPHKKPGENNRYLILENISTPYNAVRPVVFTSISAMASRFNAGYSTTDSRFVRPVSTAICQVCHTGQAKATLAHHKNFSSTNVDRAHKYVSGVNYQYCPKCHVHTSGFLPVGSAACGSCHNYPPTDTGGKHATHTNSSVGYSWGDGALTDDRSAGSYGFSCGRCHNPYAPYTASTNGKNHYGATPGSLKNYTADVGFGKNNHPLPTNSATADYIYGARNGSDTGAAVDNFQWSIPSNGNGTCRNLYCHGQFYNGYTSNNPTWANGSQTCGACHGAKRSDPPGKTNGVNWGAHPRHVGNSNSQYYGSSGWKFGCSACHYPTVQSSMTSIDDRSTHVDGRVNIEFNGGGYGDGNSTYNGFATYTGRKPTMSKPAYSACGRIYCHSDGSRTLGNYSAPFNAGQGTGTARFPNWSSTRNFTTTVAAIGAKARCARCHGNTTYHGITAAMPNYTSNRPGKGNSHRTHVIANGYRCNVCHSGTTTTNNTIASTLLHVNKVYDVAITSPYNGGGAAYDGGTHTCSNVKCHGKQTTPVWGTYAICQNCHLSSTGDVDKRILPRSKFDLFTTSAAPKIYSSAWADRGHGRTGGAGNPYAMSGNPAAGKTCTNCHGTGEQRAVATKHGSANNPFRLYTAPDRPNVLCSTCHGTGGSATKNGIFTHESSVTGQGHNYSVKCIDCHDPHGDNNIFMLHSTLPRPANVAKDVPSGKYGVITSTSTRVNVDFTQNQYSSDYARHNSAPKVCQVCHVKTQYSGQARFQFNTSIEKNHGTDKCTTCHQHSGGFKGAGCSACHGNPPDGTKSVLGGSSTVNVQPISGAINAGSHNKHIDIYGTAGELSCSYCHQGGMYGNGAKNSNIDIGFNAFTRYTGALQKYNGKSAVATGFYGYSGKGAGTADDTRRCNNMKCHGGGTSQWLTKSFGTPTAPQWGTPGTAKCGMCHGAKRAPGVGSWPTSNAHAKHAGFGTTPKQYDFMCKLCHNSTVLTSATTLDKNVHVNGLANFQFYTGTGSGNRVYSLSNYSGGDTVVNSGFGRCLNTYCHSRGTIFTTPYNVAGSSLSNYTALWSRNATATTGAGKECSLCHGSKALYTGMTSAMPSYATGSPKINSHKKHVIDNQFACSACHARTVKGYATISSINLHVNKVYDVAFPGKYDAGGASYASNKCSNIKCHGGRITPAWGGTTVCSDCHYGTADVMNYTFKNFTNSNLVPKIYSGEWAASGHGKSAGNYNRTNNPPAGKVCYTCHVSSVNHNTGGNFFRLTGLGGTTDPSNLCKRCHGTSTERNAAWMGNRTGIQGHTYKVLSSSGYKWSGTLRNMTTWRFQPKCTDCHDPHGDSNSTTNGNIAMIRNTYLYNYSGSDSSGRPNNFPSLTTVFFEKYTGTRSFDDNSGAAKGRLCAACHKRTKHNGDNGGDHSNGGKNCRTCHQHKKGFTPAGCNGCHGDSTILLDRANWAPPKGPTGWSDSWTNMSSLHRPHAYNPRSRPGFGNQTGFACNYCHDDSVPAATLHNSGKNGANMNNLTSTTGWNGRNKQARFSYGTNNIMAPADDTCWNTTCHTPRAYQRTWQKPKGCSDCHGYQGKTSLTGYNLHTTEVHKIHVSYTTAGLDKKKYGFACTRCHYNNANNYSTHYNGMVNFTTGGNFKESGAPSTTGSYGRGKAFKGITTRNELTAVSSACSKIYCHGNFTNGTTTDVPMWKKGLMTTTCTSCHKGKLTGGDGSLMPETHPKHVSASAGYGFTCAKCHVRTTSNITTVIFNYSSHVNGRKDVYFDNAPYQNGNGSFYTSPVRYCKNIYCHSKGTKTLPAFNNRSALSNYTAKWGDQLGTYKKLQGQKAKCNYCHGNKVFTGVTAAMPNYSSQIKPNSHNKHVVGYGFMCKACHKYVTTNNTSIDAAGGRSRHVSGSYNVDFSNSFNNNTGLYTFIGVGSKNRCKSTYCHSRGTDLAKPFNTRTSFSTFTAMWGDTLGNGSYKQAKGFKAKCNYCHGNRAYTGTTSAMPNYSTATGKANSHRVHVIVNGIVCSTCHNNIAKNNTSISDRSRHVNGFYNISIEPAKRGTTGQKVYSMVYNGTGGTCMNNTCHGAGKPKWGGSLNCFGCHVGAEQPAKPIKTVGNGPNPVNFWEYTSHGHGRSTAFTVGSPPNSAPGKWNAATGQGCYRTDTPQGCHSSSAGHTTKDVNNPFRLYTAPDRPDKLCSSCHGVGGSGSNTINILAHNKTNTSSVRNWPFTPKCVDCHDPHGDTNAFMMRAYQNSPTGATSGTGGSGAFGNVTGNGTATYGLLSSIVFNNEAGRADGSFASVSKPGIGICENCHSSAATPTGILWYNQEGASNASTHSGNTTACTGCHKHDAAFKGGGESSGNQECSGCHSNIFNPMSSNKSYHHVMQNTTAVGPNKYPIGNVITQTDARRRCLMCHVDHNVFRPDMNAASKGRAGNLRSDIFTKATSNLTATFERSDWSGTNANGGICLSCHTRSQTKSTTKLFNDGSTRTLRIYTAFYRNSPHNYTAIGVINSDNSRFKANCLKCHNDTTPKTKWKKFGITSGFGLHDSKLDRINALMGGKIFSGTATLGSISSIDMSSAGWTATQWNTKSVTVQGGPGVGYTGIIATNTATHLKLSKKLGVSAGAGSIFTIGDPPEEDVCYNCHSMAGNPNSVAGRDYYNAVDFVNSKALKMEQTFNGSGGKASAAGTTTTLIDSTKAWTSNQWSGWIVKLTIGAGSPSEQTVVSNTATSLTVSTAFKKATATSTVYAVGNPYRHRIDLFAAQHQSDEGLSAPGTATSTGWFADTGAGTHVGCADCHNPHAQRKPGVDRGVSTNGSDGAGFTTTTTVRIIGKNWAVNSLRGLVLGAVNRSQSGTERMILSNTADRIKVGAAFSARLTGVYVNITPRGRAAVATDYQGNLLNGPNNGQWGVNPVKFDKPLPNTVTAHFNNISAPTFSKLTTLYSYSNKTYQLCLKCHSKYGWGTAGTPFRAMDTGISATLGTYTGGLVTDISAEINPNNLAHHALIAPGNNQPLSQFSYQNIASAGTTTTITIATADWTASQWINYYVTVVSGAGAGQTALISGNTTTQITFAAMGTTPNNTSIFTIAKNRSYLNPNWPGFKTGTVSITTGGAATFSGAIPSTVIPGWYLWTGNANPPAGTISGANGFTGWYQVVSITDSTHVQVTPSPKSAISGLAFHLTAGLGNNFVPPYGPWSVINCADCHDTDAADDPSGPHGSGRNWVLRKMEAQKFPWFDGTNVITVGYDTQGWVGTDFTATNTLCLNCHRADIYGNEGNAPYMGSSSLAALPTTAGFAYYNFSWRQNMSRQPHSPDTGGGQPYDTGYGGTANTFRVMCMICHAGGAVGQIHGTNLGASVDQDNATVIGSGLASFRGKRFLVGSTWTGVLRGTTSVKGACYVQSASTKFNSCADSLSNATFVTFAMYDYEGGTDY